MRLFSWMQNKLSTGKQENNKKSNTVPAKGYTKQETREEFSDWPQGLLSIGTFGNDIDIKEIAESQSMNNIGNNNNQENITCSSNNDDKEELLDIITPEEVGKLQKVLTKLLSRNKPNEDDNKEMADNLPLDRFLNCPSSLEVDRRISNALIRSDSDDYRDEDIDKTISAIIGRCKEVMSESNKKKKNNNNNKVNIGKKSISFLLKKMFVCRSGFAPAPSFRDTLQESRMEKILRTMLHKTISPQNCYRAPSMKKYLEDKITPNNKNDDQENHHETWGTSTTDSKCKWVKTDSEYIVLEI